MGKTNPFTLRFGRIPPSHISRINQLNEITESFDSDNPVSQVYMITGVRGSGKTVLLTELSKYYDEQDDWVVVALNPDRDLLNSMAAKLYESAGIKNITVEKSIGLSIAGLTASVKAEPVIMDVESIIEKILKKLRDKKKKVLITIDEVTTTPEVKAFASAFQIFIREELPVYLIMTGLYDNIRNLQNQKTLTFLYRAPQVFLPPLKYVAVAESYKNIFNCSAETAKHLAVLTCGYSFAYQVLGYLLWENNTVKVNPKLLNQYDSTLADYAYEKIWSELSEKDRHVMRAITESKDKSTASVLKAAKMEKNEFSVYRDRLKKQGLLDTSKRGFVYFQLPRFEEFIRRTVM